MTSESGLLVVDVQNDFCPGGALPVPEGDAVVPVLNRYIDRFAAEGRPIYASRDWHPEETEHFEPWGGPWPPHCVRGTRGAEFHPELELSDDVEIVSKAMAPDEHGYTAFEGITAEEVPLAEALRRDGVDRLYVGGLATDYCVQASAHDALDAGFEVVLLLDAVRGIDAETGDVAAAIDSLIRDGAATTTLDTLDAAPVFPGAPLGQST